MFVGLFALSFDSTIPVQYIDSPLGIVWTIPLNSSETLYIVPESSLMDTTQKALVN
jgi:hypothetical protein